MFYVSWVSQRKRSLQNESLRPVWQQEGQAPLITFVLYCVLFVIHNNTRGSSVPKASCYQSDVKAAMPLQ